MTTATTLRAGYVCPWLDRARCDLCDSLMAPVAHHTGDGWTWGWSCPECGHYTDEADSGMEWPFYDRIASPDNWRAAGFEVV